MTHPSHLKNELSMILALRNMDEEVFDDSLRVFVSKVEMMLESSPKCNCCKQSSSSESRSFKLQFLDKISTPIFTGDKIKGEGCASLRVALYDCLTGAVVDSGREANANIELVVLKGDNSTVEDFEQKIVKEIKGKKSLLKGKTMLKLKEGCCDMGDISFIHNSDWVKVCQLSLAVRVVDNFPGTTIEPAMTENFTLKDCRTRLPNKKYPPALSDEIWRLEKIGKKGANHDRLKEKNIRSVEDFLKLLVMEPERLKMILSIGAKTWKVMTEHANTCLIDESLQFCYYPNAEQKNGVIFNVVGKLKGLLRESQYVPVGELSDVEKANAHKLVMCAFKNGEKLTPYNDENSFLKTCPPFSGPLRLENPNECIHEPQVNLNSHDYAQPGASPYANIPSISCAGESSTPDHGQFHYDASVDHFEECV